jgi:hypothetical protein
MRAALAFLPFFLGRLYYLNISFLNDQVKEDEMGGACSMNGG